jgi:hypothetical protein
MQSAADLLPTCCVMNPPCGLVALQSLHGSATGVARRLCLPPSAATPTAAVCAELLPSAAAFTLTPCALLRPGL